MSFSRVKTYRSAPTINSLLFCFIIYVRAIEFPATTIFRGSSVTFAVRNISAYILWISSIYNALLLYLLREVAFRGRHVF